MKFFQPLNQNELKAMGCLADRDGRLLDNRDGFYDIYPDDFIREYDCRTCIALDKKFFEQLMLLWECG